MNEEQIWELINEGENAELECKLASGGIPKDVWYTYSAFSNTNGGIILLGIKEDKGIFTPQNVDVARLQKDFWDNINDPQKVSSNILQNHHVKPIKINGHNILKIVVPRASREQKPVYYGQNPHTGTYRRDYEGNYRCSEAEVRRMLAEQTSESQDSYILPNYTLAHLHMDSIRNYRKRFLVMKPDSDWNNLDDVEFLIRIGAWKKDIAANKEGLTMAGLLMFGDESTITSEFPRYFLDYREKMSDSSEERWSNRITSQDGNWSGNLFDFYFKVIQNVTSDVAVPFAIEGTDYTRTTDTRVHKALREAVLNTLIHANYSGDVGIVIVKEKQKFIFSNPGVLRMPIAKAIAGGNSDPRNPNIFKMFFQIGLGERSGYGLESIHTTWKQQHWTKPSIIEEVRPERTTLTLSTISLLPSDIINFLSDKLKDRMKVLSSDEVLIMATAAQEKVVSNARMQELTDMHAQDISKSITKLLSKGLLTQQGYGRGTTYTLSDLFSNENVPANNKDTGVSNEDAPANNKDTGISNEDAPANNKDTGINNEHAPSNNKDTGISNAEEPVSHCLLSEDEKSKLFEVAEKARTNKRLNSVEMKKIIIELCTDRYLTSRQIAEFTNRTTGGIARYLRDLIQEDKLRLIFPKNLYNKFQAYKKNKDK